MNWTEDSFTLQENCIVTLESPFVAAAYLRDFEDLWKRPRHLDKSGRFDVDWSDATFEGQPVRVRPMFCPGRGPEIASLIGSRISCARERVLICSPVLTSGPILGALSDVIGRGEVPVTGVIDRTQMQDVLRQWGSLPKASWKPAAFRFVASHAHFGGKRSIPWGPGTVHDFLHAKLVVCDDWAFVGSYNHSRAGEENAENVLAMDGKACADRVAEAIRRVRRALRARGRRHLDVRPCLTGQLDRGRPQLATQLLEQGAAHLRHVHRQRERMRAQAGEQRASARSPARARGGRRPARTRRTARPAAPGSPRPAAQARS